MNYKGIESKNGDEKIICMITPVLEDWLNQLEKFTEMFPKEALYKFNERATLSTLSVSFYKMGYFILEEFSADKTVRGRTNEETRYGRINLYFGNKNYNALIEAKQMYFTLTELKSKNSFEKIFKTFNAAMEDAKYSYEANKEVYDEAFAISFIVPHIHKKNTQQLLKEFIKK